MLRITALKWCSLVVRLSRFGTAVEHSTHNPKIKVLDPDDVTERKTEKLILTFLERAVFLDRVHNTLFSS